MTFENSFIFQVLEGNEMYYLIWIPIVISIYIFVGWLSVKNNRIDSKLWYSIFILIQCIPGWALVSKWSKRVSIDALLYDTLLFLACNLSILYFSGDAFRFSIFQKIGALLVITGFVMLQIKR